MEQLFSNPYLTLLVIFIVYYVGEKLFLKKDDKDKIERDINNQSQKIDGGLSLTKQEFTGAIHNLELKTADKFADHSDKFNDKIGDIWEKAEQRFLTKEMNKKQEERIEMVEKAISEIRSDVSEMKPYLEQITMIYDMLQSHINKEN